MPIRRILRAVWPAGCLLMMLAGCSSTNDRINVTSAAVSWRHQLYAEPPKTSARTAAWSQYLIGPRDVLQVDVFQNKDLSCVVKVSERGTIMMPLVGQVAVAGLTEMQASDLISKGLQRYLQNPNVNVTVKEYHSRSVAVIGAVNKPGAYELMRSDATLLEVLAMAEGLREDKASYDIIVLRSSAQTFLEPGGRKKEKSKGQDPAKPGKNVPGQLRIYIDGYRLLELGDMSLNIRIFPGDVVRVPPAGTIQISGMVTKPGEYTLRRNITILSAPSLAGGLKRSAEPTRTKLIRQLGNGKQVIVCLNLVDIANGESEDILLQNGDYIEVPKNFWKALFFGTIEFIQGVFGIGHSV